jgi:predicted nucleotidyltransferase
MILNQHIRIPSDEIAAFCERYHIRKLSLFGSVLREDFGADSDVDVLVEFDPAHIPGWEIVTMQNELSTIIDRPVDFLTPGFLSDYFRQHVLDTAQVVYERA